MNTLYIVGRSDVYKILELAPLDKDSSAIIFIDEGTKYANKRGVIDQLDFADLYILEGGIEKDRRVDAIDYDGWVELLEWADRVFSLT
ncbi:MAG: hypothetical protein ACLFVP_01010 [Candidatus Bathyarchaeia archaeon]